MTAFGTLLARPSPQEIILKPGNPGYMSGLSEETRLAIEEIENNIRRASAQAPFIFVG